MQQVQQLISQGNWQQAEEKLVAVSSQVAGIGDQEQKQQLLDQFNDLSAKVVEKNRRPPRRPGSPTRCRRRRPSWCRRW